MPILTNSLYIFNLSLINIAKDSPPNIFIIDTQDSNSPNLNYQCIKKNPLNTRQIQTISWQSFQN